MKYYVFPPTPFIFRLHMNIQVLKQESKSQIEQVTPSVMVSDITKHDLNSDLFLLQNLFVLCLYLLHKDLRK